MQASRRQFLQAGLTGAAAVALTSSIPSLAAASPALASDNILVLIQLSGGNDGLNTVIPTRLSEYRTARPHIAITDSFHPISNDFALNPGLTHFKNLFDQGKLAIVNGCGYPQPNRSHFRSLEIWHTADPVGSTVDGWLARYLGQSFGNAGALPMGVHVGSQLPQSFAATSGQVPATCLQSADDIRAFHPRLSDADYPRDLGAQLQLIARLIDANKGTRVFSCQISGFDTHANQLRQHESQLRQLDEAVAAFYKEISSSGHADKVTVMCFSEFGRRLAQNNSNGTDHGAAGPVFVIGNKVKGGFYGAHPSLTDLDHGDLKYTTDFRRVYSTLLDKWLNANSTQILGNRFEPIAFL